MVEGLIVVLEDTLSNQSVKDIIKAIKLIKGVVSVSEIKGDVNRGIYLYRIRNEVFDMINNYVKTITSNKD